MTGSMRESTPYPPHRQNTSTALEYREDVTEETREHTGVPMLVYGATTLKHLFDHLRRCRWQLFVYRMACSHRVLRRSGAVGLRVRMGALRFTFVDA